MCRENFIFLNAHVFGLLKAKKNTVYIDRYIKRNVFPIKRRFNCSSENKSRIYSLLSCVMHLQAFFTDVNIVNKVSKRLKTLFLTINIVVKRPKYYGNSISFSLSFS